MPVPPSTLQKTLCSILRLHYEREKRGEAKTAALLKEYSKPLAALWQAMANIRRLEFPEERRVDPTAPGYVIVKIKDGSAPDLHVPFHLVPSLPDAELLRKAVELAPVVCLGGAGAVACLSGSSLLLGDIIRIGDIDFCEYMPQPAGGNVLEPEFRRWMDRGDRRRYPLVLRLRTTLDAKFEDVDLPHAGGPLTDETITELCSRLAGVCNGKAAFLVETAFAGTIESTNWLIMHKGATETDPVSGSLSFALQEAAIGTPSGRVLDSAEAVARYLDFLLCEISRLRERGDPVKAIKRALPLLRLFGESGLAEELVEHAHRHRAFSCAAAQARLELLKHCPPDFDISALSREIEELSVEALAATPPSAGPDLEAALQMPMAALGRELEKIKPGGAVWDRILAVAPVR